MIIMSVLFSLVSFCSVHSGAVNSIIFIESVELLDLMGMIAFVINVCSLFSFHCLHSFTDDKHWNLEDCSFSYISHIRFRAIRVKLKGCNFAGN